MRRLVSELMLAGVCERERVGSPAGRSEDPSVKVGKMDVFRAIPRTSELAVLIPAECTERLRCGQEYSVLGATTHAFGPDVLQLVLFTTLTVVVPSP
mmetsp:Transcript_3128/g.9553  ORF Transcript_3128/g.9553 Transcript_3128/m.9553 type:complete len:97 (-) Transcript_3128:787-1077(-)